MSTAVRAATRDDRAAVARLLERNGLPPHDEEHWERLWSANPALGACKGAAIGWTLESDSNEIVGYLGNVVLEYRFRDRSLLAAATHAWAVDARHRNYSIQLVQSFLRQKGIDLFLNTTANFEASRVFDALRVPRVPTPDYDVSLGWVTGPLGTARSLLRHRGVPGWRLLQYPIAAVVGLRSATGPSRRANTDRVRRLDLRDPDFDRIIDTFWNELQRDSTTLLADRSARALRWRLDAGPAAMRLYVQARDRSASAITGWALVRDEDNPRVGLRRRRIVDVQYLTGPDVVASLLGRVLADCRRDGVHTVEAIGFSGAKRASLRRLASVERRLPSWMFFWRAPDPALARVLARPEAWDPCSYDGDGCL